MPKFVAKTLTKDSDASFPYANDLEARIGNAVDPLYDDVLVYRGRMPSAAGWEAAKNFETATKLGLFPVVVEFKYKNVNGVWLIVGANAASVQIGGNGSLVTVQLNSSSYANYEFELTLMRRNNKEVVSV